MRVSRRAWAGIVWWLLDVTELYSKVIAPELPVKWVEWLNPYAIYLDVATPWVVSLIILGALLYTYYESEQRVTRDPAIPSKLREFYVEAEPFSRFILKDEAQLRVFKAQVIVWYNKVDHWIAQNMSAAAASKFRDSSNILPFHNKAAVNQEHNDFVNLVNKLRSNLQDLIASEAWDEKEKGSTKKWRLGNIFRLQRREKPGS
jgi:hypothetical protein